MRLNFLGRPSGEIDPQDLLAIEGLRLFDEAAFYWVRDSRDFFFNDGRYVFAADDEKKAEVGILKGRIPDEKLTQVLQVLTVLFPQSSKWLDDRDTFGGESLADLNRRRGIGSQAGYDSYFALHPSSDAIPKTLLTKFFSNLEDANEIERTIRAFFGKQNSRGEPMVGKLLDELRTEFRVGDPPKPTPALLEALFRVGEDVIGIDWTHDSFAFSPRGQIIFLIRNLLELWGQEQAGERLMTAFQFSTSPAFMASIYVDRGRELGVFKSDSSERPLISRENFDELGQILVTKIEQAANSGTLETAPFFFDITRAWSYQAAATAAKAWLAAGIIESAEFMAKASRGLGSDSFTPRTRR